MGSAVRRLAILLALASLAAVAVPSTASAVFSPYFGFWYWQSPMPRGEVLNGGWFVDDQQGWLVGDYGAMMHTADGGASWMYQDPSTTVPLRSVCFPDALHGWAVGEWRPGDADLRVLVRTTNGGVTWRPQSTGITGTLNLKNLTLEEVRFVDARHGWIVGSFFYNDKTHALILATSDGGAHWRQQGPKTVGLQLKSVCFTDARHGWAVGDHYLGGTSTLKRNILTTSDGGSTWHLRDSGVPYSLEAVSFADSLHGWAVGALGKVATTADGGVTWTSTTLGQFETLVGVAFTDASHGLVVGNDSVWRTIDGGASWSPQSIEAPSMMPTSLVVAGDSTWIIQSKYYSGDRIDCGLLRSQDGGVTWLPPASDVAEDVEDLAFVDRLHGWAAGESGLIIVTSDGGWSWFRQTAPTGGDLAAVEFADTLHGWAVGEDGIIATADGGLTWQSQTSPTVGLTALSFVDAAHGWAAGGGTVVATTDGGATWNVSGLAPSGTVDLDSISFVDELHGWVAGSHVPDAQSFDTGCIYRTSDGGQTWQLVFGESPVRDVCFVDAEYGWLSQEDVYDPIMRTTDGGLTWSHCDAQMQSNDVWDLELCDRSHGVAVGVAGTVLQTTDGQVWWAENSGYALDHIYLGAVSFIEPGHAWVGGRAGTILAHPDPYLVVPTFRGARPDHRLTLTCRVSDAAAVRVTVTIKIRNSRNRVVKTIVLAGRESNGTLKASFIWKFAKGTYRMYFSAKDAVGKSAPGPVVRTLKVR